VVSSWWLDRGAWIMPCPPNRESHRSWRQRDGLVAARLQGSCAEGGIGDPRHPLLPLRPKQQQAVEEEAEDGTQVGEDLEDVRHARNPFLLGTGVPGGALTIILRRESSSKKAHAPGPGTCALVMTLRQNPGARTFQPLPGQLASWSGCSGPDM